MATPTVPPDGTHLTSAPPSSALAARRLRLRALGAAPFDLLVIGGGITGAGVARDAALRGLRTALVEQDDFASGTSSRSSRLVHGGGSMRTISMQRDSKAWRVHFWTSARASVWGVGSS